MWLLPPHFWPIIYLWTMVGLSCRPAHELLWQRLKGKHLLERLLPPWGCKKDGGNVYKDKDRGSYRHPGRLQSKERSSLECGGLEASRPDRLHRSGQFGIRQIRHHRLTCRKTKFSPPSAHRPARDDVLHYPLPAEPWGSERQGRGGGCDIKDPPRCQMGPQLDHPFTPAPPSSRPAHT